jgi:BirA family biotin operon repressor/biotin-[acetyl-CoA-carboxylase] ligase
MTLDGSDEQLLRVLADGRFHSGEQLAATLGMSRTAVWKRLQCLRDALSLELQAVRGRGHRLARPIEFLDERQILSGLAPVARRRLDAFHVALSMDSTNSAALAHLPRETARARVWLAEHQSAGRGRRGRHWVSVFGSSLYLSLAWRFNRALSELAGLSLVAGIVVAETLQRHGIDEVALKWPNDVLLDGRKLCGVLVEASGESSGPAAAVIGIGLNVNLPAAAGQGIDQPWADLSFLDDRMPSRNRLASTLVSGLIEACEAFSDRPLSAFLERWQRYDALRGRPVHLHRGDHVTSGTYRGVAANGAVLLETTAGVEEHLAGEVSLRQAAS